MALRFLVIDGNIREARERHRLGYGLTPSEAYAAVLQAIAPDAHCDIALPADEGANPPDAAGLESYDGVVMTGSGLHAYDIEPAVTRQVELARAVFAAGTPFFGSCWGLQIAAVAAGGAVAVNPRGREVGFARNLALTDHGRSHPMLTGRPGAYDAPAIHLDEVATLPSDAVILAGNAICPVQAAEIRHDQGVFWGVQYHPEFDLREITVILDRYGPILRREGLFADDTAHRAYIADLAALATSPARADLAWRYGIGPDILDSGRRLTEIRNFVASRVRPLKSARGRA